MKKDRIFQDSHYNISHPTCSSHTVTLTLLPSRGGGLCSLPLESGLVYDYGESVWLLTWLCYWQMSIGCKISIVWFSRLGYKRQYSFCLVLLGYSLFSPSHSVVRKPKLPYREVIMEKSQQPVPIYHVYEFVTLGSVSYSPKRATPADASWNRDNQSVASPAQIEITDQRK